MATEDPSNKQRANGAPPPTDKPPPLLASAIADATLQIVRSLETLPELAQRRIIEGVRVALGLSNPTAPPQRQQQQQPPTNQRRQGNGQ